jgi:hypothetical protein
MRTLTVDEVLELLKATPEQAVFDWKQDFVQPTDEDKKGEFLKDLTAIAREAAFYRQVVWLPIVVQVTARFWFIELPIACIRAFESLLLDPMDDWTQSVIPGLSGLWP